jgi:hypothetical protein
VLALLVPIGDTKEVHCMNFYKRVFSTFKKKKKKRNLESILLVLRSRKLSVNLNSMGRLIPVKDVQLMHLTKFSW